jgi:hypothetical protein
VTTGSVLADIEGEGAGVITAEVDGAGTTGLGCGGWPGCGRFGLCACLVPGQDTFAAGEDADDGPYLAPAEAVGAERGTVRAGMGRGFTRMITGAGCVFRYSQLPSGRPALNPPAITARNRAAAATGFHVKDSPYRSRPGSPLPPIGSVGSVNAPLPVTTRWKPPGKMRLTCPVPADGDAPLASLRTACGTLVRLAFVCHRRQR